MQNKNPRVGNGTSRRRGLDDAAYTDPIGDVGKWKIYSDSSQCEEETQHSRGPDILGSKENMKPSSEPIRDENYNVKPAKGSPWNISGAVFRIDNVDEVIRPT